VVSTLAASYLSSSARSAGAAADLAASRKEAKYTSLTNSYICQPIGIESHGALSLSALSFLTTLGERLTGTSGARALLLPLKSRTSSHPNFLLYIAS